MKIYKNMAIRHKPYHDAAQIPHYLPPQYIKNAPSRHGKERYNRDILLNLIIQPLLLLQQELQPWPPLLQELLLPRLLLPLRQERLLRP